MNISFENQFLCDLINSHDGEEQKNITRIDWDKVYQLSVRHQVDSYLYFALKNHFPTLSVPEEIMNLLRQNYHYVAACNVRIYHELSEVLKCLNRNRIPVIVLKGAYLAEKVYENPALRPMSDLDLLVKKDDLIKSVEALNEIGFLSPKKYYQEALDEAQIHIPALEKPGTPDKPTVFVELHWSVIRPGIKRTIDINQLWERAVAVNLGGIDTRALSPEDNLHHLALHTAFDDFFGNGLISLLDMVKLAEKHKKMINWNKFIEITKQANTGRYSFLCLRLAKDILGAVVPEEVLDKLQPQDFSPEMVSLGKEMVFRPNDVFSARAAFIGRTIGGDNFLQQSLSFLRKVFHPRAVMSEIYGVDPNSLKIWFYYPVRFKDVFFRYISVVWQLLSGNRKLRKYLETGSRGKKLVNWLAS